MMKVPPRTPRLAHRTTLRGLVMGLAVAALLAALFHPSQGHAFALSFGTSYWVFAVTIDGQVLGRSFRRSGLLLVTTSQVGAIGTTNGANPVDFALLSGNPAVTPETGAIQLATNQGLLPAVARSQLDLAYVAFSPQVAVYYAIPDAALSATGANVFNAASGLAADLYQVFDGLIYFGSADGYATIFGELQVAGTGALFHSNSPYYGRFSGPLVSAGVLR